MHDFTTKQNDNFYETKIRLGHMENEAHTAHFFPVYVDNNLPLIGQKLGTRPSFQDCVNLAPSGELFIFSI